MVFCRCLINSKSPRIFRTLFSILAVSQNAVTRIVSIPRPISSFYPDPFQGFGDRAKLASYMWYHRHPNVP